MFFLLYAGWLIHYHIVIHFPKHYCFNAFGKLILKFTYMIIGRNYEVERLENSLKSDCSELIAVYGRRRIGKTYLIRNVCKNHIKLEVTGLYQGSKEKQLDIFFEALRSESSRFSETDRIIGNRLLSCWKNILMDWEERVKKWFSLMRCHGLIRINLISGCISGISGIPFAKNETICSLYCVGRRHLIWFKM